MAVENSKYVKQLLLFQFFTYLDLSTFFYNQQVKNHISNILLAYLQFYTVKITRKLIFAKTRMIKQR